MLSAKFYLATFAIGLRHIYVGIQVSPHCSTSWNGEIQPESVPRTQEATEYSHENNKKTSFLY